VSSAAACNSAVTSGVFNSPRRTQPNRRSHESIACRRNGRAVRADLARTGFGKRRVRRALTDRVGGARQSGARPLDIQAPLPADDDKDKDKDKKDG